VWPWHWEILDDSLPILRGFAGFEMPSKQRSPDPTAAADGADTAVPQLPTPLRHSARQTGSK
jgi:hypothetical protein